VTAAFRMLAYGIPADYVDEYVRIGESTAQNLFKDLLMLWFQFFLMNT
jgi:hypothetical protein